MKKTIQLMFVLLMVFAFQSVNAQEHKQEVDLIESAVGKSKKDFVKGIIDVPVDKSAVFWNLYNKYDAKRTILSRQRVNLTSEYISIYNNFDDKIERKFMHSIFKVREESRKNMKHFYERIRKEVSPKVAMQFFQVEEYIRSTVDSKLLGNLPFN